MAVERQWQVVERRCRMLLLRMCVSFRSLSSRFVSTSQTNLSFAWSRTTLLHNGLVSTLAHLRLGIQPTRRIPPLPLPPLPLPLLSRKELLPRALLTLRLLLALHMAVLQLLTVNQSPLLECLIIPLKLLQHTVKLPQPTRQRQRSVRVRWITIGDRLPRRVGYQIGRWLEFESYSCSRITKAAD